MGKTKRVGLGIVRGRSMLPTLRDGDRVVILYGARPKVGGLAVLRLPGGVIAIKRAVRREPGGWWVERDNPAEGTDSWSVGAIPDQDILGRVLVSIRRGRRRPGDDKAGRTA